MIRSRPSSVMPKSAAASYEAREQGDNAAVSSAEMRGRTRLGFDEMDALLEKMLVPGWVAKVKIAPPPRVQFGKRVSEGADNWVLLANVHKITVADVYRLFVFGGMSLNAGVPADSDDEMDRQASRDAAILARQVETAVEAGLGITLAEHFGAA